MTIPDDLKSSIDGLTASKRPGHAVFVSLCYELKRNSIAESEDMIHGC